MTESGFIKAQSDNLPKIDVLMISSFFSTNTDFISAEIKGVKAPSPSCTDREDTVHPEWLLDSTANNWYDIRNRNSASINDGPSRILSGSSRVRKYSDMQTIWTLQERQLLLKEMAKYGRNVRKISQTIKTKTEAEIQALIEAEHGIRLDTPSFGLDKTNDDLDDVPSVVQEEIVTEDEIPSISHVINMVTTGTPTITIPNKQPFKKKNLNRPKNSLLKPNIFFDVKKTGADHMNINPSEIFYEDDLILGSTESVGGADMDSADAVSKKLIKDQKPDNKPKPKSTKKIGNHRRKNSRNYDKETVKIRNKSKDNLKSPQRVRKDSSLSEDSTKSPKLQIVFSSGQALPVSEGEQVIKIEKKKDSEPESDIEIDIDSDNDVDTLQGKSPRKPEGQLLAEEPIAVPLRKFEPMPRRQKKINLDGEGGFTIMHTESGDLYEIGAEPRRERSQKKTKTQLIQCRLYNSERPAPYEVRLCISTLICMDVQAHTSRAEVMGLLGGELQGGAVTFRAYRPAAAAASRTHCDMDPVSQALAAESLRGAGYSLIGWHHSHPSFPPSPSALDLRTQSALQTALERPRAPFLALITSQHWPTGRAASQYRCVRVESTPDEVEAGFQLSVKLLPDLSESSLPPLLHQLHDILRDDKTEFSVDMSTDTCPQAGVTYLEKCISSVSHHLRSAGYAADDPIVGRLVQGLREGLR